MALFDAPSLFILKTVMALATSSSNSTFGDLDLRYMPAYSWCSESKQWRDASVADSSIFQPVYWNETQELKCATFNVLFDIYQNNIVQSDIRYAVQIRMLEKLQLDVLSLNEMTPPYLVKFMNEKWVQDNYYISETETGEKKESGHSTIVPYGNLLMLSKHKFNNVKFLKYKFSNPSTFSRRAVLSLATLKTSSGQDINICFGSVHLKAKKECFDTRKKQCQELYTIAKYLIEKNFCKELIYLGDWNLNMPFETHFISHNKEFTDLWLKHYDIEKEEEKGFTMDATLNPMIEKMNPGDTGKRLRLDRVVQWNSNNESILKCSSIKLFATNSVKKLLRNKLLFTEEEAKNHLILSKDYLYCSDHFGIYFTLRV
ncbi:hypothetical protein C9374_000288 [Naegleria lovaniensis]|uniref:Endonuclease/exonuclease/phosphatase domain-containing protein n=1 Tax=Naegleria lovaniensis TaxID=51637 RepID=A0AA88H053_NAELO|nr:uncharacterized protein C9374_000288 [Naegleria lovaniensis]KAG2388849.1 hypothetical protein C9374_000288 [Naegleria lovaniensis]